MYPTLGVSAVAVATVVTLLFSVVYRRAGRAGLHRVPAAEAEVLLDLRHRLLADRALLQAGSGRGFWACSTAPRSRALVLRLLGARIGKRLFDDGGQMAEKNLVTIGDDVTINAGDLDPVPLPGGLRLQVRPHHDRFRLHPRGRRRDALQRDDRRRRGARRRLVPDEGSRRSRPDERWGGNPAQEMPNISTTPPSVAGRELGQHRPHATHAGSPMTTATAAPTWSAQVRHRANR